jgi:hypothetical protein
MADKSVPIEPRPNRRATACVDTNILVRDWAHDPTHTSTNTCASMTMAKNSSNNAPTNATLCLCFDFRFGFHNRPKNNRRLHRRRGSWTSPIASMFDSLFVRGFRLAVLCSLGPLFSSLDEN